MPKLKVLSGREVRAILEANGFVFDRQRGSHMILRKGATEGSLAAVSVAVPDHREIQLGTLKAIIAQSGLPRPLFETKS